MRVFQEEGHTGFPVGRTHRHLKILLFYWENRRIFKAPRVGVNVHLSQDSENDWNEGEKSEKLGLVPTRLIIYSLGLPHEIRKLLRMTSYSILWNPLTSNKRIRFVEIDWYWESTRFLPKSGSPKPFFLSLGRILHFPQVTLYRRVLQWWSGVFLWRMCVTVNL